MVVVYDGLLCCSLQSFSLRNLMLLASLHVAILWDGHAVLEGGAWFALLLGCPYGWCQWACLETTEQAPWCTPLLHSHAPQFRVHPRSKVPQRGSGLLCRRQTTYCTGTEPVSVRQTVELCASKWSNFTGLCVPLLHIQMYCYRYKFTVGKLITLQIRNVILHNVISYISLLSSNILHIKTYLNCRAWWDLYCFNMNLFFPSLFSLLPHKPFQESQYTSNLTISPLIIHNIHFCAKIY
jgi:hypothetical protein